MDFADFSRDFFEHLAAPALAGRDVVLRADGFGAARAVCVEDSEVGGLGFAEAEEHGLGFFGVARHGGRFWFGGRGGGAPGVVDVVVVVAVVVGAFSVLGIDGT